MPAVSKKVRRATAIAEHNPEKLYARNKGLLKMSQSQLHDYASTPEKGLPNKAPRIRQVDNRIKRKKIK